jgi:hypothetical protein
MTRKNPRNNLPRLISGIWLLNLSGAIGLIAFFWFLRNPVFARPALVPTLTSTIVTTPIPNVQASLQEEKTPPSAVNTIVVVVEPSNPSTPTPRSNQSIIGSSVAGRPLEVFRFGKGPTARLIIAGIHGGNEWNTIKLANELMKYVEEHPEIIPKEITLYILPSLNPDGEARIHGLDGRVNDNGVDLNRNWPYRWEKDFVRTNCWDYRKTTAGPYAASEPETAALLEFIVSHPEIDALISYHAAALGIFAGGVPVYKPSVHLAESIAKVSTYQYPPKDVGCKYTGNLTDWAANTQEIAAVDIELHNFKYTDFDENLKILKVFLNFKKK